MMGERAPANRRENSARAARDGWRTIEGGREPPVSAHPFDGMFAGCATKMRELIARHICQLGSSVSMLHSDIGTPQLGTRPLLRKKISL